MNILISSRFSPSVGGIETFAEIFASELTNNGYNVRIITPDRGEDDNTKPYKIIRCPSPGQLLSLLNWCDVYIQNQLSIRTAWALLIIRRPWIIISHTWIAEKYKYSTHSNKPLTFKEHIKLRLTTYAINISVSKAISRHLPGRSVTILNFYDNTTFTHNQTSLRDKDIAFVGRLTEEKGVDILLEAVMKLKHLHPAISVSIIGDGPDKDKLQSLAATYGIDTHCSFIGIKKGTELTALLNQHKVVAIPTRAQEPFGIVALEAAACGCIIVGSTGGGLEEAIGPCGLLFKNGDPYDLATQLDKALSGNLAFNPTAIKHHLRNHNKDVIMRKYIKIINIFRSDAIKILLSNAPKQYSHKQVYALYKNNMLFKFVTSFWYKPSSMFFRLINKLPATLKNRYHNEFKKRYDPSLPTHLIITFPYIELLGKFVKRYRKSRFNLHLFYRIWLTGHDLFCAVVVALFRNRFTCVIGYELSSSITFAVAKLFNKLAILDLAQIHPETTRRIEHRYRFGTLTADHWYHSWSIKRNTTIFSRADHILVLSEFAKQSMVENGIDEKKLSILSPGVDTQLFSFKPKDLSPDGLTIISVGAIAQRKGLEILFKALAEIGSDKIRCVLIGSDYDCLAKLVPYKQYFSYYPFLHHEDLVSHYQNADVFVLDSYLDSWGQVVLEAMACGTPVIVSENTGAKDSINEGINGFIIPPGDVQALKAKLLYFLHNKSVIKTMGESARRKAEEYAWDNYDSKLIKLVRHLSSQKKS